MTTYTRVPSREMHLGKRLHDVRTRLNLSATDVAQRYGLPLELLPSLEAGAAIPPPVVPAIRQALAEIGERLPARPVIVDANSRRVPPRTTEDPDPAAPAAQERVMTFPVTPPPDEPKKTRSAPTLPDEDRELLARLKPERERRGLTRPQAAKQIGVNAGGYNALEEGRAQYLRAATRQKLQAWLAASPTTETVAQAHAEIEAGWREIEAFAQVGPYDQTVAQEVAALDQLVADAPAVAPEPPIAAAAPEPTPAVAGVTLADLMRHLPAFNSTWPEATQLRWFDSFDQLAALITTEVSS